MTSPVAITVPGLPVAQPRHRAASIGGMARLYLPKSHPVHAFKAALRAVWPAGATFTGPVAVTIDCLFPRAKRSAAAVTKRPDCDNLAKAVCDALNGLAWRDDSQITTLSVSKRWAVPGSAGEVRVLAQEDLA